MSEKFRSLKEAGGKLKEARGTKWTRWKQKQRGHSYLNKKIWRFMNIHFSCAYASNDQVLLERKQFRSC